MFPFQFGLRVAPTSFIQQLSPRLNPIFRWISLKRQLDPPLGDEVRPQTNVRVGGISKIFRARGRRFSLRDFFRRFSAGCSLSSVLFCCQSRLLGSRYLSRTTSLFSGDCFFDFSNFSHENFVCGTLYRQRSDAQVDFRCGGCFRSEIGRTVNACGILSSVGLSLPWR